MCPPRTRFNNRINQERPYLRWLNTAVCCRASFHLHRINRAIICAECYACKSAYDRSFYDSVIRHYIHIGPAVLFEECRHCRVIIPQLHTIQYCPVCPVVIQDFLEYLDHSGDTPYLDLEPTILAIEQIRTPGTSE